MTHGTAIILTTQQYEAIMSQIKGLTAKVTALEQMARPTKVAHILTVEEAAQKMRVSTKTIYRRIEEQKIKTVLINGKSYGIDSSEIEKYLERGGDSQQKTRATSWKPLAREK